MDGIHDNEPTYGIHQLADDDDDDDDNDNDDDEEGGSNEFSLLNTLTSLPGWSDCAGTSMASAAHHAAYHNFPAVLEALVALFDLFVVDDKQRTPLFYACAKGHIECVKVSKMRGRLK